jgi:hypothetical protein
MTLPLAIAGLDPAIHRVVCLILSMDAGVEPAHDEP